MPITYTPLRYPGGKTSLYPLIRKLMEKNALIGGTYVEPFAGGAGIAMKLLRFGEVKQIYLNDKDPLIAAFWHAALYETQFLCEQIRRVDVTIEEWHKQKEIVTIASSSSINIENRDLGFAIFFLNRTNRSGVIKSGPIGGTHQNGNYKIDARFNKKTLIEKISFIGRNNDKIHFSATDAKIFIEHFNSDGEKTLFNIDPPYVQQGQSLYMNYYTESGHSSLAEAVSALQYPWIVTYDDHELVRDLYKNYRFSNTELNYSIGTKRKASELIIVSDGLIWEKD